MRFPSRLAPRSWLRLPASTARLRLTILYGALFLASGAGLLAITYLLVSHTGNGFYFTSHGHSVIQQSNRMGPARDPQVARVLAQAADQHASYLHHLLIWSGIALAIMAVVSIALGYYVAGRVLKPLRTITSTARAITARNLDERLALTGPEDEFKALGDTLDDLLTRLQTAFDAQRHFVANASHELRTPIAWEQTLLQVALADPDASNAALREACQKVLTASKQQQHLIEALLTLATSERGLDHPEPIDLSILADTVLLTSRPEVEQQKIEITATIDPAPTTGDPALVERLIANLIDNAVRYNTPSGHVHVQTTTSADGHAQLTVSNTGPAIPASEVERLFEPFQRLTTTRANGQSGYGLGLSIVQAIATAHHAQLTAQPRPGGGLTIEVSFQPRTTPSPQAAAPSHPGTPEPQRRRSDQDGVGPAGLPGDPTPRGTRPRAGPANHTR